LSPAEPPGKVIVMVCFSPASLVDLTVTVCCSSTVLVEVVMY
jgi:hypothetical protein